MKSSYLQFVFVVLTMFSMGCATNEPEHVFKIKNEKVGDIPGELFGHFLEKPSWHGELGPEAALKPGTYQLQNGVVELLQEMNIPLLRFPGGTDVDHMDWTAMIGTPEKEQGNRPLIVGNKGDTIGANFGYDEAGKLAERLGAELMLVVNFGDAYFERKPLEEAAMHEAALLAYCAVPVGVDLPGDLEKWPELRAANGHPGPYPVKYVQIANEPFVLDKGVLKMRGAIDPEKKAHYMKCLEAYIDTFKKVAPSLKVIADGNCEGLTAPLKERFGDKIDYVAYHKYYPWAMKHFKKGEATVPRDSLTEEEIWNGWIAIPDMNEKGYSVFSNPVYQTARDSGYPIALTEWNWNGWWTTKSAKGDNSGSLYTKGVGAAGMIHAIMRSGAQGDMEIATQSMLIGNSWGIHGIRVSPEADFEPYPFPTGQVTGLYATYHGNELLKIEASTIETYEQPYEINDIKPEKKVAYLDVMATRGGGKVYFHVINRSFAVDQDIVLDLTDLGLKEVEAAQQLLTGNIDNDSPCSTNPLRHGCLEQIPLKVEGPGVYAHLPKRSVSIIEINGK